MTKVLEKSYKIDTVVKMENKLVNQTKIIQKQELKLKDTKNEIRGQNRFFKGKYFC